MSNEFQAARVAVDHLFICVREGGHEAQRLISLGLYEGSPNAHPGQGTRNRRFFFQNFMLELIWLDDPAAAASEAVRRTLLLDRCQQRDACPFGVCLVPFDVRGAEVPFPAWGYRPPYAPDSPPIQVATGAGLDEPMWFYLDFVGPIELRRLREAEPKEHPIGVRELTRIHLSSPTEPPSEAARVLRERGVVTFAAASEYLAELTFDGGGAGAQADLRPDLPLILRW